MMATGVEIPETERLAIVAVEPLLLVVNWNEAALPVPVNCALLRAEVPFQLDNVELVSVTGAPPRGVMVAEITGATPPVVSFRSIFIEPPVVEVVPGMVPT